MRTLTHPTRGLCTTDKKRVNIHSPPSPPYSYFAAGAANISTSSSSSELGIRFRASLTRRLFYGVEGGILYERIRSRIERPDQSVAHNRYLARRARAGVGLGFFLTSRILLNLDVAGGLFNSSQPAQQPASLNGNFLVSFSSLSSPLSIPSSPSSLRGTSVSVSLVGTSKSLAKPLSVNLESDDDSQGLS